REEPMPGSAGFAGVPGEPALRCAGGRGDRMAALTGPLRVRLATGASNGASPPLVIELGDGEATTVDGAPEPARLVLLDPPRARLADADELHEVLVLPIETPGSAATGVQRLEVVLDGWRFEVDLEPEARARLRDRAIRADADRGRGGPVELRAIIPG